MWNFLPNGEKLVLFQFIEKEVAKDYRLIWPLPLSVCNKMFEFFTENDLIFQKLSGFKSDDTNQVLAVTHTKEYIDYLI